MRIVLVAVAIVLAVMLGGPIRERWQDSNDFARQEQQLQLERQQRQLADWYAQQQATTASRALLGNMAYLGAGLAGVLCLMMVVDFYRQRRRPLAKFGGELVARSLIESADPALLALLAERIRLSGMAQIEAARNTGQPHVYSPHITRPSSGAEAEAAELQASAPAPALTVQPGAALRLLADWKERKLICQSDNSLLLGFDKAIGSVEPSSGVYLRLGEESDVALLAVSGDSGSGKTSTMRFLMAQAAMRGASIVLCDPHGRDNQQSLVQSCSPLATSFLIPPAVTWDEIHEAIQTVDTIGRNRLSGGAGDRQHVMLVIDEWCDVARNAPDIKDITRLLINVADLYRKVNLTAFLVVHHWRINEWKSGTLKDACQGTIFHRMSKSEAKLFVSDATLTQQISFLPHGDALYFKRGAAAPTRLTGMPYVTRIHLDEARDLYIPAPRTLTSMAADADGGTDGGTDTHCDAARPVLSAYARALPSVRASVPMYDAPEGASTDTSTDTDTDTPSRAQITEAERVRAYLEAYALAGMTRESARETLARKNMTFANSEWTEARRSINIE